MAKNRVTGSYGYNVLCDRCGFKFKSNQVRLDWKNQVVCDVCYEPRHPMEFLQNRTDAHQLPFVRSNNDGIDVSPDYQFPGNSFMCSVLNSRPLVGTAVVGCATLGLV